MYSKDSSAVFLFLLMMGTFLGFTLHSIACTERKKAQGTAEQSSQPKAKSPPQGQEPAQKVLTMEEFSAFIRGQIKQGDSSRDEVTITIQISPELPNYLFRLVPDSHADEWPPKPGPAKRQHVGRIEISKSGSGKILQTIEVEAASPIDSFLRRFVAHDINFDRYLDIATEAELGGAKWQRYQYWLFDKTSGQFVTNWLTRKLGEFGTFKIYPDPESEEIHVGICAFMG
jgi:hypothetical protein